MHAIVRSILTLIIVSILLGIDVTEGGEIEAYSAARIDGKLFIDGQLGDKMVEVRLETRDASLVSTAVTSGSHEFSFNISDFRPNENYFLVIRNPDYKELRKELDIDGFRRSLIRREPALSSGAGSQDYNSWYFYTYANILSLELESLPKSDVSQKQLTGPKTVDVGQFESDIPKEAKKEYELAMESFAMKDSHAAQTHLEKAIQLAPKYLSAIRRLGLDYLKEGQYEKAEPLLVQAHDLNPKDSVLLTNLGTLHFQKGEKLISGASGPAEGEASYRRAVEFLEQALLLDPNASEANFYLGTVLYRTGDYQRAESLLLRALDLDRQEQEARLSLLNIYLRQKRYDAALEQIYAYLEAKPDTPEREQLEGMAIKIEAMSDR